MVTTPTAPAIHPHVRGADRDFPASDGGNERFIPTCVGQDRLRPREHAVGRRFIPTCVGQIAPAPALPSRKSVHPHVRGADAARCAPGPCGSRFIPTCVGQIPSRTDSNSGVPRFIPTCVGQMVFGVAAGGHGVGSPPRAWGRFYLNIDGTDLSLGSSPRAWGRCGPLRTRAVRITVHPHVRGADVKVGLQFLAAARFIPTCVGQMRRWNCRAISICGSSPRAWGRCCG